MDAPLKRKLGDYAPESSSTAMALGQTISSTEDPSPVATASTSDQLGEQSRYAVESEFARGGLGRILKAHDERLDRPVAIKELLTSSPVLRDRFAREVAITARLQHPSIVPIYDASASRDGGEPFYVMKLLTGSRTLKEVVAEREDLDARLALLPNLIAVADAIAYAHSEQIIHRDLKPSNILVGAFGETVVIDWGLAKDLSLGDQPDVLAGSPYRGASAELTSAGSVLGTPQYMAPEQARGEAVDKRADVYALGALLYHVLVGRAPYRGRDSSDVLELVLKEAPQPIGDAQPGVPADLRAIVAKAMARDSDARYADAEALAADLRRFQTGQLVSAHDYSNRQLFARWLLRHRVPVIISALFTLTLLGAGAVGLRQIVRERDRAEARAHELLLTQARSQLEHDPTAAVAWAKMYPPNGADWPAVQELAADAESRGVARHVLRRAELFLSQAAFSHDGRRIAAEEENSVLRISDVATGKVLARIHHGGTSKHVVWSDDDRSLVVSNRVFATSAPVELIDVASGTVTPLLSVTRNVTGLEVRGTMAMIAGGDGQLWLWDLQKRTGRSLLAIKSRISSAQLARDGRTIVFTAADGVVRIVDVGTGALIGLPLDAVEVAFTADGSAIFVADKRGVLATVDLRTQHRAEIGRQNGHILALAVASDGSLVATGSEDHMVYLWNLRDHSMRAFAGDAGSIFTLHFSPDNRQLASGGSDTTVRVWQLETGVARVLRGHAASVQSLAYSADGRYLVSTAEDRTARVWETSELFPDVALSGHQNRVVAIAYSPDGRHLATASDDLTVRLWSLPDGRIEAVHQAGQGVSALTFSPDGARLAIGGDRAIVVWDVRSGAELSRRELLPETCVWSLRFSADGHRLAAATDVGVIYLISDGELQLLRGAQGTIRVLAFSPDGRTLVSGGDDHEVSAWDVASGGTRHTLQRHADNVTGLAFTPDGKTLISSSWDGTLRLRDLSSGAERSLRAPGKLSRLALSRSGRFVAAAATDGTAALWDLVSGARRLLQGHTAAVLSVEFSPDERLLLSSGYDKSARVWDVATGEPVQIARSDGYILASAFSSIGAGYATGGEDRFVHLWPARAAHATSPSGIRQRLDQLTTSALSGTPAILKTQ